MKWSYLAFLPILLFLIPTCMGKMLLHNSSIDQCVRINNQSGVIFDLVHKASTYRKCWIIEVPQDTYVRLYFNQLSLHSGYSCYQAYLNITVPEKNDTYMFCSKDTDNWKPITTFSLVTITFYHQGSLFNNHRSSFNLSYHIEDMICVQKSHFRCSNHSCIHQSKVCDGINDCQNGVDEIGCEKGILAVKGIDESRENAINWLKNERSASFGWGKNTHRAITALYLARAFSFTGQNLEEELVAKQLELQTSMALLRNSTDSLPVSELSMFVNALTVTCHNPRRFFGHDLLEILSSHLSIEKSQSPGAYLTLCNSNWTLSESDIRNLLKYLHKHSKYPFLLYVQALTVMALTCVKSKTKEFTSIPNASKAYNATIEKFIAGQLSDGSFGNVYTTALVTQALIASGQEDNKRWNVKSTMKFLMEHLNSSSVDFLSAYLALPIFRARSLVDIGTVDCANISRKQEEDNDISDVTDKLGGKMRIQFSLYVGDQKDVIHTIILRIPESSSAYEVMRVAQAADPKYKFLHRDVSGHMYIYEIAGITNDPEAGKFWLLYSEKPVINGTVRHHIESPDHFMLEDAEHLIMWYKTAHI